MPGCYRLAIDLGTCNTVAVIRRRDEAPRALLFDGSPLLPSGVHLDPGGHLHVGRDAERLMPTDPARFEPYPKRRIDDGRVLLGDREVSVIDMLVALLRRVVAEARLAGVAPEEATVLTCPADWGPQRRRLLLAAARAAGLGAVALVDEPIAAAHYCLDILRQQVHVGQILAIFDFGGGTLDVTLVERRPEELRVLATGGLDNLGGVDVDEALVGHLGQLVAMRDPQMWRRLSTPADTAALRDRRAFWTEARSAKEMLSRSASAPLHVPGSGDTVHVTREELERIAGPLVDRAVDETRRVIERAGADRGQLAGIFLVGGSSRMPLVASRLHARFRIAPSVPEQPELPVASGALLSAGTSTGRTDVAVAPATPATAAAPVATTEWPAERPSGRIAGRHAQRRGPLVPVIAAIAVLAMLAGAYGLFQMIGPDDNSGTDPPVAAPPAGGGRRLERVAADIALPGGVAVTAATDGSVAYHAVTGTNQTTISAVGGANPWRTQVGVEATRLRLAVVNKLLIMDAERAKTHGGKNTRSVLDAATGRELWTSVWEDTNDVAFVGTDAIVATRTATVRIRLSNGKTVWKRDGHTPAAPVLSWSGGRSPGLPELVLPDSGQTSGSVLATGFSRDRLQGYSRIRDGLAVSTAAVVAVKGTDRMSVLDAATGRQKVSARVPMLSRSWIAFDGVVAGIICDSCITVNGVPLDPEGRQALAGYGLGNLARRWTLRMPTDAKPLGLKPCGPHLGCAVWSRTGGSLEIHAINLTTGKEAWFLRGSDLRGDGANPWWFTLNGNLVAGIGTAGQIENPQMLNPADGQEIRGYGDKQTGEPTIAVAGAGRLVALVDRTRNQTGLEYQVAVVDASTGESTAKVGTGAAKPKETSMAGAMVTVITDDNHLLVLRASGLST